MVTGTSAVNSSILSAPQTGPNKPLGRDVFLKLLVTQLRNQDPLAPMEDKEFISQLAQFSSLEEMQGMNQQMEAMGLHVQDMSQLVASSITNNSAFAALNLIGRTIEALDPKDPNGIKTVRGTVDGVKFTDAGPILRVGDMDIPLSKIRSVFQPAD